MKQPSDRHVIVLDKDILEKCFTSLGKLLKKRIKGSRCELIVVGGASIVLNYGFRLTTMDVDCTDEHKILMNDIINIVAEKYGLPGTWINTNFMNTKSYSPKLSQYSSYYKTYGNVLEVRTIKDIYLLAMKVASARKYKNDYSDILGIVLECHKNNNIISFTQLEKAIIDLYGSLEKIDKKALEFAKKIIENPKDFQYEEIRGIEKENATTIKTKIADDSEQADIDYILSKLDIA